MVKRKVSEEVQCPFELKKKKVSMSCSDDQKGTLDCCSITDPTKLMDALLGDTKLEDFFENYWEKKPLLIKRKDSNFYGNIFALSVMKDVLEKNELNYQEDVNVCRYVNGEKELLNEDKRITEKDVDRLIDEKQATFQFHHPQRYMDELWNMLEKMERYFGTLVGCNAYITPPSSQGLAPHCDDVEIFVLHLEGKKSWKLYKPMVELSRDYTQDLLQESIGEPVLEATLEPGDMLYFPRGYIHQATAGATGHSTHISISTYQQNTWGDFMNHAVTQAIENALEDDVTIRSGLPINYMNILGTGKNMAAYVEDDDVDESKTKYSNLGHEKVKEFKEVVKKHLSKLVDHIDVNTAADAMCADFMASRLPPYGHCAKEEDEVIADPPTLTDSIKIRYPEHVRVVYCDEDEDDGFDEDDEVDSEDEEMEQEDEKPEKVKEERLSKSKSPKSSKKAVKTHSQTSQDDDDDDDDEDADIMDTEPHIKIVHSLNNDRFAHMGGSPFDEEMGCLKLNVSFAKAAIELLKSTDFVAVKDLLMDEDDDKVTLATTLFSDDLVEIKKE